MLFAGQIREEILVSSMKIGRGPSAHCRRITETTTVHKLSPLISQVLPFLPPAEILMPRNPLIGKVLLVQLWLRYLKKLGPGR